MGRRAMGWAAMIGIGVFISCLGGCHRPHYLSSATRPSLYTQVTEATQPALEFPLTLPNSALIAEYLVSYDGDYWEDGSGEAVKGVTGLMVYNPTDRMVAFEAIAMEQEGETLHFFVYQLPPQSRCLVLEKGKKVYTQKPITTCRELSTRWEHQELSREQLDYLGVGPQLTIINRDGREQEHVTLWYKQYVKEGNYYLGGVAHSTHLFFLQPEEYRTIKPKYYNAANARIVAITLQ